MATARNNLPKEMTPFGKGAKKANPFGGKSKAPPFMQPPEKGKKPGFAGGGTVTVATPSARSFGDGKPSGGGQARGGGAATKGKRFQGTF